MISARIVTAALCALAACSVRPEPATTWAPNSPRSAVAEAPAQLAPMPNPDLQVPAGPVNSGVSITLDTTINHRDSPDRGLAFSPGSRYQIQDDKRPFALPGVSFHVPIE